MKSFPFHLICKRYYKKNTMFTPGLEYKMRNYCIKVYGHDKTLLHHMKPENNKNISIPSGTTMNQPQTQTSNISSITSDSKANITFSKATNSNFTKSDSVLLSYILLILISALWNCFSAMWLFDLNCYQVPPMHLYVPVYACSFQFKVRVQTDKLCSFILIHEHIIDTIFSQMSSL